MSTSPVPATFGDPLAAVRGAVSIPGRFRRVAALGGIYSNYLALEATLRICRERDVDAVFCLGDLGGFGPFPDRTCETLRTSGVMVMQGNYDASLAHDRGDCGCGYTDPRDNRFARIAYDYTAAGTSAGHRAWMRSLPPAYRFRLGGAKVLTCHGSPRETSEFLWESGTPDGLLRLFLDAAGVDLILGTHTGIKWQRRLEDGRVSSTWGS